jgi:hypothetical protein
MLKLLRSLVAGTETVATAAGATVTTAQPPAILALEGAKTFAFAEHIKSTSELPIVDWAAVSNWIEEIEDPALRARAWTQAELAWLAHLQSKLGPRYRISRNERTALLSSLEPNVERATLDFMTKTRRRIAKVLEGLAHSPEWGHDILVVFDDDETYYRYVSAYYPDTGAFAASGGMYVNAGCGHFVTMKADLRVIEPVVVHEMTHGCLSHLPIPAWLNEGLAVNTEQRLSPPPPPLFTPQQMHAKHKKFWRAEAIQEFWSGKSFLRPDDGSMLSYDLARILVSQFATEWDAFRDFVLSANLEDAGQASAIRHLGVELGAAVCAILEQCRSADCSPDPSKWLDAPERGAFYG